MTLFETSPTEAIRLRVAAVTAAQRQRAQRAEARRRAAALRAPGAQLGLFGDTPAPVARQQPAQSKRQQRPQRAMVASVFDLAATSPRIPLRPRGAASAETDRSVLRIIRDGDRTRCERLLPQETDEWQQKEAARRARQKLPKPPKRAKTISRKLAALVGEGDDE